MIYLIDDNRREQQLEYGCAFLSTDEYSDVVKTIYTIGLNEDVSYLVKADVLLIHYSFPDFNLERKAIEGQTTIYEKIIDIASDREIPLVIFSNGFTENSFDPDRPLVMENINKRQFYLNLKDFLDNFRIKKKPELKILAYGKHFVAQELLLLFDRITGLLTIEETVHREEVEILLAHFNHLAGGKTEGMQKLKEVFRGASSFISFTNYLEKITQSFIKYGRNIYH